MKTVPIYTYLLLSFFTISLSHAQNGGIANYWCFGDSAAIHFSTGSPISVSGPINTLEGVATISDINGNLLFSTDGSFVYNRNNQLMPNGAWLLGNSSSTQSAIIVPDPANPNQYYIFTSSAEALIGALGGVAYSVVNMTLNNGLGDVILKNVQLVHPAAEKLTAVRHCNGTDYWVICHKWNSNAFYAYQVSATGIAAPIISNAGSIYQSLAVSSYHPEAIGYLKASPNGKRLAAAITYGSPFKSLELFDFDNATGIVSNPIYVTTSSGAYGLTFSPDNTKLYVGFELGNMLQYDLTAPNISTGYYQMDSVTTTMPGAFQIGPDGKIYITVFEETSLTVINNPNVLGVGCNYVVNAVPLNFGSGSFGLPNFPDNLIATNFHLGNDITLCDTNYILNAGTDWSAYLWSTGATTPSISINQAGTYWVAVTSNCGFVLSDTIEVYPSITGSISFSPNVCGSDTTTLTVTAAGGYGGFQYSLNGGAYQNNNTFQVGLGTYTVTIKDSNGCVFTTNTLSFNSTAPLTATAMAAPILCHDDTTLLSITTVNGTSPYQYSLNGGVFQSNNTFTVNAGNFIITVQDANGCTTKTSNLYISNPPLLSIVTSVGTLCYQSTTNLTIHASGGTGIKQFSVDASPFQSQNHFAVGVGNHTITIQDVNNCTVTTMINLTESLPIDIQILHIDSAYCNLANGEGSVVATGGNGGFTYTWFSNPKQYNDTLTNASEGSYHIRVRDSKGCTKDTILFIPNIPPPQANYISRPDKDYLSIYENDTIQFFPNTIGVYSYSWDFRDGTFSSEQNPIHVFSQFGEYPVTLTVYDEHNECPQTYTLLYKIISHCSDLYIPTAFSPNGDGYNDVFFFSGNAKSFEATIFDRWGKEITRFTSINDTWDGKTMPEGVYTYVLTTICEDGKALKRAGSITLTR